MINNRRNVAKLSAIAAAGLLLLLVSAVLLSYGRWVHGILEGNRALANGDIATALQAYDVAARHLDRWPFMSRLPGYRQLVFNRARALYGANKNEELTRMLEAEAVRVPSMADDNEYHFWMGNVQFRQAIAQKDQQVVQAGLQQAAESYRRSLAAAPDDWDAKYDYERTIRLLDEMRKGKEDNLERIQRGEMKILREDVDKSKEQQQKMAPEKRG
jgi:hypothetical protein